MKNKAHLRALFNLPDVFMISYPKSGRTWLRVLLGKWLCLTYGVPENQLMRTTFLSARCGVPIIGVSHDGSEMEIVRSYKDLSSDKSRYESKKVILLTRDIKDTLVSAYFHVTRRDQLFDGTISEFLKNDYYGVKKILTFYKNWSLNKHIPREFVHVTYEELRLHPAETFIHILNSIGIAGVTAEHVEETVAFADFTNMKRMEATQVFNTRNLSPRDVNDNESYKVRKGKVGGYVDYLCPSDIAYINEMEAAWGCEFTRPRPNTEQRDRKLIL